jgi:hypothetical protein
MADQQALPAMTDAQRRILVVAPPKSGSTYISHVLRRYLSIPDATYSSEMDWGAEHRMDPWLYIPLRGRIFCFNFHMFASPINLELAKREGIALIALWRNLGDVIVSLDEHIHGTHENGPMYFIRDMQKFSARPQEERHAWIIDTVASWYLTFYLRWRIHDFALHPYEEMLRDERAFFTGIFTELLGAPPPPDQLEASLGVRNAKVERVNVGRIGRSATTISEANKRRLEGMIFGHPDFDQLEVLLWELPWRPPDLEPLLPLDGAVVRAEGDDPTLYFVSRGIRHVVSRPSWLASRFGALRTPREVPAAELRRYRLGEPLD